MDSLLSGEQGTTLPLEEHSSLTTGLWASGWLPPLLPRMEPLIRPGQSGNSITRTTLQSECVIDRHVPTGIRVNPALEHRRVYVGAAACPLAITWSLSMKPAEMTGDLQMESTRSYCII